VEALAHRMEQLGSDHCLRQQMAVAARTRALCFDWPRYHGAIVEVVNELSHQSAESTRNREVWPRNAKEELAAW
jgi:alpha-maltose-1-phosphate synthase